MKRMSLKEWRLSRKLTQVELSKLSGVGQTYISKLELGVVANPAATVVFALADALKASPRSIQFGQRDHEEMAS